MSYDLYLKSDSSTLFADAFPTYFSTRRNYTVNNNQAFYENEDTGVYFSFDFAPDEPDTVAFNLNYFRPHFFGLEAAPEVAAFISTYNLAINDPQNDAMGDGPFSIEGFLRGWNAGNRFGYRAILSQDDRPETHVYPTAELERVWEWNLNRSSLQNQVGERLFVPRFMFFKEQTQARTAVVWPDACPIFIPKADTVIVLRDQLSNQPAASDHREVTVVEWSTIEPIVQAYSIDKSYGQFRLEYDLTPDPVAHFIRSLPIIPIDPNGGLACDSVLNAELVLECTSAG